MAPYIYGVRNNIHIIDLTQTVPMLHQRAASRCATRSPKAAASSSSAPSGRPPRPSPTRRKRCAQYYVNSRWLGGTLTNWKTISKSIERLRDARRDAGRAATQGLTKKELLAAHPRARQARALARRHQGHGRRARPAVRHRHQQGSDRHRRGAQAATSRSWRWSTPIAIPTASPIPIPGNDDAGRAIALYCDLVARAAIDGISRGAGRCGHGSSAPPRSARSSRRSSAKRRARPPTAPKAGASRRQRSGPR